MMNRNILNPMMWNTDGPTPPTPTTKGIYWSQSLGLISLSSNGETWTTIADKNLGASQVYNDGDTLSDNNCGACFQWGNNVGFSLYSGTMPVNRNPFNATNYGPYYESSTFIQGMSSTERRDWSTVHNPNLWGGTTAAPWFKIGPATNFWRDWRDDELFGYVPTSGDFENLGTILSRIGVGVDKIFLPSAGWRVGLNGDHYPSAIMYWSSTASNNGAAYSWHGGTTTNLNDCVNGFSIRCFLSMSITSEDERTMVENENGYIKWSPSKEYIKAVSGIRSAILLDKNLGATQIYQDGDPLTSENCGNYFQRGNNYGFPGMDTPVSEIIRSDTQVDATNYGPYAQVSPFRQVYGNWCTTDNPNLWGGVTGTMKSHRGPCARGYHVPTDDEWSSIYTLWTSLGGGSTDGIAFRNALKIPFAGYLHYGTQHMGNNTLGNFWTVNAYETSGAHIFSVSSDTISPDATLNMRSQACPIRPFKDAPIAPDSTWTKLF